MLKMVARVVPEVCGRTSLLGYVFYVLMRCPERDIIGQQQLEGRRLLPGIRFCVCIPRQCEGSDGFYLCIHY